MKKITRWSPDTCGCVIDYEWDTDIPAEERTHTSVSAVACQHHRHHDHHAKIHAAVVAENQGKNRAVGVLTEKLGISHEEIAHSFDEQRGLVLAVPAEHAAAAKRHLADNGHGHVQVTHG